MLKKRKSKEEKILTHLYIYWNHQKQEIVYSGIQFYEFIKYLKPDLQNILLLKAEYDDADYVKNFKIIEGKENIELLSRENIKSYGDFCFVDCKSKEIVDNLKNEQIAELLFIGHMFEPLNSPFFDIIDNKFAYLSHDDGYLCRLYCKNIDDFYYILEGKIINFITNKTGEKINSLFLKENFLEILKKGIYFNLNDYDDSMIKIYDVGKEFKADYLFNNYEKIKNTVTPYKLLVYKNKKWDLL